MTKKIYNEVNEFMLSHMLDSAHDKYHVYRVLNYAVDIASYENVDDMGVLIAACLLHDIGREQQFANPKFCHAQVGGEMAYDFLLSIEWTTSKAQHVKECILSHRYRGDNAPHSIEAKILSDADRLDVSGAIGIARTLTYEGQTGEPLYILDDNENIIDEAGYTKENSFFQEYNYKLKNVYDKFYTEHGRKLGLDRQKTAIGFYEGLFAEINTNNINGMTKHDSLFTE